MDNKLKEKIELKMLAEMGSSIIKNLEMLDVENIEKLALESPDYLYSKLQELAMKKPGCHIWGDVADHINDHGKKPVGDFEKEKQDG